MHSLRDRRELYLMFFLLVTALCILYWPVITSMVRVWNVDDNYSHGFIVPFIAGYLAYMRRDVLLNTVVHPSYSGFLFILLGLAMLLFGWLATEYFSMRVSLVVTLAGIVLTFLGKNVFKLLLVPMTYLLLMVPIPAILYDAAAFPLKLFVTKVSVIALKFVGIVVWQEGNVLMFPNITLEVADACSGLRSIVSLLALGAAYAFVLFPRTRDRVALILSTLPIAVFTNCLRVIATGFLAQFFGSAAAEGFFHEFAGFFVFFGAMMMFVALGTMLKRWE